LPGTGRAGRDEGAGGGGAAAADGAVAASLLLEAARTGDVRDAAALVGLLMRCKLQGWMAEQADRDCIKNCTRVNA
jgi:hypothetical protein